VVEVGGHQRLVVHCQDALERAVGGGGHQGVDFFLGGGAVGGEGQVDQRDVDGRHAQGEAIDLADQLRQHQADGLGGTGLGRDDVGGGGAGAAQVLVADVHGHLVVGVGVDGGHQALLDADAVGQDLGNRGQAVGRAGGVGDDGHAGLQRAFVNAHDDGGVDVVAARGGDQHALGALVEQGLGLGLGGVGAGAFEQHVHAVAAPVDALRILGRVEGDLLAVDDDAVLAFGLDGGAEAAVRGVVLEQVGVGRRSPEALMATTSNSFCRPCS
jgi:hypothetical protein